MKGVIAFIALAGAAHAQCPDGDHVCLVEAATAAGIEAYPHLMRHSHATISYRETKDPKLVQNTLGHSDVSTTLGLYVDEQDGDSSTKHLTHLL